MIYIACALYDEAFPWIKRFGLKKNTEAEKFQIFENSDIRLMITGVGNLNAAAALTYMCTLFLPSEEDIFVNTGACGLLSGTACRGTLFLIHKITGDRSGRQYYPDILYEHSFREAELISCEKVQTQRKENGRIIVTDMEAEGLWCAANIFFSPDRIAFIKYISDFCGGETVTKEKLRKLSDEAAELIVPYMEKLKDAQKKERTLNDDTAETLEIISEKLKATQAMKDKLYSCIYYYELCGKDAAHFLNKYKNVECRGKKEGKIIFEEILRAVKGV